MHVLGILLITVLASEQIAGDTSDRSSGSDVTILRRQAPRYVIETGNASCAVIGDDTMTSKCRESSSASDRRLGTTAANVESSRRAASRRRHSQLQRQRFVENDEKMAGTSPQNDDVSDRPVRRRSVMSRQRRQQAGDVTRVSNSGRRQRQATSKVARENPESLVTEVKRRSTVRNRKQISSRRGRRNDQATGRRGRLAYSRNRGRQPEEPSMATKSSDLSVQNPDVVDGSGEIHPGISRRRFPSTTKQRTRQTNDVTLLVAGTGSKAADFRRDARSWNSEVASRKVRLSGHVIRDGARTRRSRGLRTTRRRVTGKAVLERPGDDDELILELGLGGWKYSSSMTSAPGNSTSISSPQKNDDLWTAKHCFQGVTSAALTSAVIGGLATWKYFHAATGSKLKQL